MKLHTIKYLFLSFCAFSLVVACSDDDNGPDPMPDPDTMEPMEPEESMEQEDPDFSGTYAQADFMGRPGINTVLSPDDAAKNDHNVSIPSEMEEKFQPVFEAQLEGLHDVYANLLGLDPQAVNYEPNILGDILNGPENDGTMENQVTATVLTMVLANDVLEIAPDAPTTYFNPGSGAPDFEGAVGLTGRTLQDDVIDVSLILLFGGADGARFSGQDTDDDGEADLPRLTSDGVAFTASPSEEFPYLGAPE